MPSRRDCQRCSAPPVYEAFYYDGHRERLCEECTRLAVRDDPSPYKLRRVPPPRGRRPWHQLKLGL